MGQGNRGKSLERTIMELFKHYEQRGIHCQQNHPERISTGKIISKHGFDFQVYYQGTFYAFDAKECNQDRWSLTTNVKIHQLKALHDIQSHGGQGFFFVYFNGQGLNKLTADYIRQQQEKGVKSLDYNPDFKSKLDILGIL